MEVDGMSDPMDEDSKGTPGAVAGVFKSAEMAPHKLAPGTNSAVSDVAVDRDAESVSHHSVDSPAQPQPSATPSEDSSVPAIVQAANSATDQLQASVAKADAAIRSIEERQMALEESFQKAEAMVAEVARVSASMSLNDELRKRIAATIQRTRGLREHLK
jgi:flagellar biosynthesis/type III secretory pathway protein FliH